MAKRQVEEMTIFDFSSCRITDSKCFKQSVSKRDGGMEVTLLNTPSKSRNISLLIVVLEKKS
jgi:hypothetical protein